MSALLIRAAGVVGCAALGFLGRWTYLHPKRFLDKFYGDGGAYGTFTLRWTKFAGALWLFVAVYGFLAVVFQSVAARMGSTELLVVIYVALSTLITWQLLKQRTAQL